MWRVILAIALGLLLGGYLHVAGPGAVCFALIGMAVAPIVVAVLASRLQTTSAIAFNTAFISHGYFYASIWHHDWTGFSVKYYVILIALGVVFSLEALIVTRVKHEYPKKAIARAEALDGATRSEEDER